MFKMGGSININFVFWKKVFWSVGSKGCLNDEICISLCEHQPCSVAKSLSFRELTSILQFRLDALHEGVVLCLLKYTKQCQHQVWKPMMYMALSHRRACRSVIGGGQWWLLWITWKISILYAVKISAPFATNGWLVLNIINEKLGKASLLDQFV